MEITNKEADKLREILIWYRRQIRIHGLPDRKSYRDFLIEMDQKLVNSSKDIQNASDIPEIKFKTTSHITEGR